MIEYQGKKITVCTFANINDQIRVYGKVPEDRLRSYFTLAYSADRL